jgi:hypothetical protein
VNVARARLVIVILPFHLKSHVIFDKQLYNGSAYVVRTFFSCA